MWKIVVTFKCFYNCIFVFCILYRTLHLQIENQLYLLRFQPAHGGYIPANGVSHPNHNYQQFQRPLPPRNPFLTGLRPARFRPAPPRRKDHHPNTVPYHDPAANNQAVPIGHFLPPTTPAPSFLDSIFGSGKPENGGSSGLGIADALYNYLAGNSDSGQNHDPYSTPYYPVGYHDYEYGDYDEGVGLYPPKKLTVSERVWKWFDGFKIPNARLKSPARKPQVLGEKLSRPPGPLDYSDYETGDDENLIFYNQNGGTPAAGRPVETKYDFQDVIYALKNNETGLEVTKKFLSAAASMTERADTNAVFMMWTIPTTVLALFGAVYFLGNNNFGIFPQ